MATLTTTRRRSFAFGIDMVIPGWDLRTVQTSAGRPDGQARDLQLAGIQLLHESVQNVWTNQFGTGPKGNFIFGVPLEMHHIGRFNGREWCEGITVWEGRRAFDSLVPPMQLYSLSVERQLLIDHVRVTEGVDLEHWLSKGCLVVNDRALKERISGELTAVLEGCFREEGGALSMARQDILRGEILEMLAPVVAELVGTAATSNHDIAQMHLVKRAREIAFDRIGEPLQVFDLCQATGACRRSLQKSFQSVLGTSPLAYLKNLRLDGARRQLLAPRWNTTVTQVAEECGFWHLSRFGQDYRRKFGELPSDTLRRATATDGVVDQRLMAA